MVEILIAPETHQRPSFDYQGLQIFRGSTPGTPTILFRVYFLLMSHSSIATKSAGLDILRSVATFEASKRRESQLNNLGDFFWAPRYNDRALSLCSHIRTMLIL